MTVKISRRACTATALAATALWCAGGSAAAFANEIAQAYQSNGRIVKASHIKAE